MSAGNPRKFRSWPHACHQYSCKLLFETCKLHYLLGASYSCESKIVLWDGFSFAAATNIHANYCLKPVSFIIYLARPIVVKVKLFFEMVSVLLQPLIWKVRQVLLLIGISLWSIHLLLPKNKTITILKWIFNCGFLMSLGVEKLLAFGIWKIQALNG